MVTMPVVMPQEGRWAWHGEGQEEGREQGSRDTAAQEHKAFFMQSCMHPGSVLLVLMKSGAGCWGAGKTAEKSGVRD